MRPRHLAQSGNISALISSHQSCFAGKPRKGFEPCLTFRAAPEMTDELVVLQIFQVPGSNNRARWRKKSARLSGDASRACARAGAIEHGEKSTWQSRTALPQCQGSTVVQRRCRRRSRTTLVKVFPGHIGHRWRGRKINDRLSAWRADVLPRPC